MAISDNSIENIAFGQHTVYVSDGKGCETEKAFIVQEQANKFTLSTLKDTIISLGDSIELLTTTEAGMAVEILWKGGDDISCVDCLSPVVSPSKETIYQVVAMSESGCLDSTTVRISIAKDPKIFIPNAFSPNGDDINDDFKLFFGDDRVAAMESMEIYDRWGGLVYKEVSADRKEISWRGVNQNDKKVSVGAYVYLIRLRLVDGERVVLSGDISLIE